MRTHTEVIDEAGTDEARAYARVAEAVGAKPSAVKMWRHAGNIPPGYWRALVAAGIASYEELAADAETRRKAPTR